MKLILIDSLIGNDYTVCLAEYLYKENVDLTFIVPSNRKFDNGWKICIKKWLPSKDKNQNVIIKLLQYLNFMTRTLGLVLSNKKVIIHFQFFRFKTDIFFIILLRMLGIKIVYTAHNIFPHETKKYDYILNYLLYNAVHKIIIHSETTKLNLLRNFNLPTNKLKVIAHGNFDNYKNYLPITKQAARQRFNLKDTDNVLLFFGYIREYKGLELLLKSFEIIPDTEENIFLIIAGSPATKEIEDRYLKIINSMSKKNNILINFDFIPKKEVELFFTATDFVVLPYKKIDHSGIVHLAYSFNKPIIATNVGDFHEIIINGETGYLVDSQNPEDFSKTIFNAFNNKKLMKSMEKSIEDLNNSKFSWSEIAKKTKALYTRL